MGSLSSHYFHGGGGLSPTFFYLRGGEGGEDSMFLFPAVFFFSCLLAQKASFLLLHKLNCPNKYTYLPYVMFKITVVKRFCLPQLLGSSPSPPHRGIVLFNVGDFEMCALKKFVHRKIRRKADQGNISMCRERGLFSCSSVSLSLFSYDSFAPRVFLVSIPNSLYVPLNPDWMPHRHPQTPLHFPPIPTAMGYSILLVSDNPYRIQDGTCFFLGPRGSTTFSVSNPFQI